MLPRFQEPYPNLKQVPGIEETFDQRNLLPSTALDPFFLYQVSTWFANARRRLKKENKMTWEPKNKLDDDDVDVSDDDMDKDDYRSDKTGQLRVQLSFQFAL